MHSKLISLQDAQRVMRADEIRREEDKEDEKKFQLHDR
jgi:hypothetical protein